MEFKLFDLGLIDYLSAWRLQKDVFLRVKQKEIISALILCQHKPTITMGRQSHSDNILANQKKIEKLGIAIYEVERGGDVTYHGPGQLCVYPVVNLACFKKDLSWFLNSLEIIALKLLSEFGIKAEIKAAQRGVWVKTKKIASVGIAVKNWITFHGISLNIKQDDLANFSLIRPCGLDIIMTSMQSVLGKQVMIDEVKEILIKSFGKYFCNS